MAVPAVALGQPISSSWGNEVADAINNLVPIGTVWMGYYSAEPNGWAFMDGREVSRTDGEWAPLYGAIGQFCGPGNGVTTWNLPNAVDRAPFCVGPTVGGLGGTGGSKDAIVVTHTHVQNAHTHVQNAHNHTQNGHNHTGSSAGEAAHVHGTADNTHKHAADGDYGFRWAITVVTANDALVSSGTAGASQRITYTDIDNEVHNHGNTGAGSSHSHGVTVNTNTAVNQAATAANQNATATNQDAGAAGTNANMPPWLGLQFVVKK